MPQSLSKILVHVVFSTKNRAPCLNTGVRDELYRYMAMVLQGLSCAPIKIGGEADHVHILCVLSKNISVAKLVEGVKRPTSKWVKSKRSDLKKFYWQNGYGAFSVSQSHLKQVTDYIANQKQHHRRITFQEEFRRLLKRYQVSYDERYVWD